MPEQVQGCVEATTQSISHVMRTLEQSDELLRSAETSVVSKDICERLELLRPGVVRGRRR